MITVPVHIGRDVGLQQNPFAGWLGRQRIVSVLPMGEPPRWIRPHRVVADNRSGTLADPDNTIIGEGNADGTPLGMMCFRILSAGIVEDTRRL